MSLSTGASLGSRHQQSCARGRLADVPGSQRVRRFGSEEPAGRIWTRQESYLENRPPSRSLFSGHQRQSHLPHSVDAEKLFVFCLERESGKILWRREVPRPRKQELHKSNSAASPSIATDGRNVFAFFTDFGLVSYGPDGEERWRMPLGPFNNPFGMGASRCWPTGK